MSYTYLASPYTHEDANVRRLRFEDACKAAAKLMQAGEVVFCPIAHSHPIDVLFAQPESGEFWKRQDAPMLAGCSKMVVLKLQGWEQSPGVANEIAYAQTHNIPVEYMEP